MKKVLIFSFLTVVLAMGTVVFAGNTGDEVKTKAPETTETVKSCPPGCKKACCDDKAKEAKCAKEGKKACCTDKAKMAKCAADCKKPCCAPKK